MLRQRGERATIADVARSAGVSKSTVSLTFGAPHRVSDATRQRVLTAAREAGYAPDPLARSLSRGLSDMIGLIVPDLVNPHLGTVLESVQGTANESGYMVMTATSAHDPARDLQFVESFAKLRLAGVILMTSGFGPDYVAALRRSGMPFITYGHRLGGFEGDHVGLCNDVATQILVRHLIARGHRRIGHIAGDLRFWTGHERLCGVRGALAEAGLGLAEGDLVHGEYDAAVSQRVTHALLSQPSRPTALIAANNVTAIGALRAIRALGLHCPSDIALATVDAIQFNDLLDPPITSVAQPIPDMARAAARLLTMRIEEGPGRPRTEEFAPTLLIGGST